MAVYAITGKLGAGKGKGAIQRIREYLRAGKFVATNCDVFLEHLLPEHSRSSVIRVPDKPTASDLYALGPGNRFISFEPLLTPTSDGWEAKAPDPKILDGFDEAHNGALVLDECASWLNSRTFGDKGRNSLLEWFIHARKYGWDVFFVMQNVNQVDKQLRESLFEYVVRMNRLDKMNIPLMSPAIRLLTAGASSGTMPKIHIGTVRLGTSPDALLIDRWIFRANDINKAYNTTQVFSDTYPHGIHCLLPNWHRIGYAKPEPVPPGVKFLRWCGLASEPRPVRKIVRKPKPPVLLLVEKLPPDERVKHYKRLQALGVV